MASKIQNIILWILKVKSIWHLTIAKSLAVFDGSLYCYSFIWLYRHLFYLYRHLFILHITGVNLIKSLSAEIQSVYSPFEKSSCTCLYVLK